MGSLAPQTTAAPPSPTTKVPRRRWRRRLLASLLLLPLGLLFVWAWLPKPVSVVTGHLRVGPLEVRVDNPGRTRVKHRFVVSLPLSGELARVHWVPGDRVMEGQTLARISPLVAPLLNPQAREEARARLQAAEASQEQALAALRRGEVAREHAAHDLEQAGMLTKTGSAPADTLDHARLEVQLRSEEVTSATFAFKVAVAQVAAAKAALERYDRGRTSSDFLLKAPISGQVLRVFQESGGVLPAGTNLLEMGDLESLEVVTDALTTDAVHMEPGQRVVLDGWGKEAILGHVRQVEPSAFTRLSALGVEEQRVKVLLDIDSPRDAWAPLGDGFRVETHVVLWSSPTAPSLPWSALFRHQEAWAVYRVENHKAWLTPVTVGHRGEDRVELLGGLSEDATVVLHPGDRIRHGVRVREEKPDSP